jgi:hypothetical protein
MHRTSRHYSIEDASQALRKGKNEDIPVGGASRLFNNLRPEDQLSVADAVRRYDHELEMGRHGSTAKLVNELGLDKEQAQDLQRFHSAAYADEIAIGLEARNREVDVPPLNSRDHVLAAFELHNQE